VLTDAEKILALIRVNVATACGVDVEDVALGTEGTAILATVRNAKSWPPHTGAKVECVMRRAER